MRINIALVLGGMLTVLLLPLAGATSVVSAQNIVPNPDFETGDLADWQVNGASGLAGVSVVSDNGPSAPGSNAAFMDNQAQAAGLNMKFTSSPGTAGDGTVSYSFDLKLGQAANGGVFFVEIFAEQSGVGVVGGSGLLGNYNPADWTNFQGSFEAPAGTDFLTIQFTAVTGAVEGTIPTMFVDNVSLSQEGVVPVETSCWSETKALYQR